uniref:PRKCSH-like domain-containing protein n=1 Tax=Gongylonema pulchrum TaxID=637853 RepID=A0A183DTQ6_9BILA
LTVGENCEICGDLRSDKKHEASRKGFLRSADYDGNGDDDDEVIGSDDGDED